MKKIVENKIDLKLNYIKAIAILFVLLLHSITKNKLIEYNYQFYIGQAMPLFMFMIGFNFYKSYQKYNQYFLFIKRRIKSIIFTIIVFNIIFYFLVYFIKIPYKESIYNFFGIPFLTYGTYFIALYLIVVLLFPFINFFVKIFINYKYNLIIYFVITLFIDIIISNLITDKFLYSLLPIRYLFDIILGIVFFIKKETIFKMKSFYILFFFNVIWLFLYKQIIEFSDFIPNKWIEEWKFQHFIYIYTFVLFYVIYNNIPKFLYNSVMFKYIGFASFYIFLVQTLYFSYFKKYILIFIHDCYYKSILYIFVTILINTIMGVIWFILEKRIFKLWKNW